MLALIFDTETTGLVGNTQLDLIHQPRVTEFYGHVAAISGGNWETKYELEFLCDPGVAIPDEVVKITGITQGMVKGKPPFRVFKQEICDLMESCEVVIAHNLAFDIDMLNIEGKLIDFEWPWPERRICTVEATEHLKGHRLNLGALYEHLFNEKFSGAHRAKADVHALTKCVAKLHESEEI